MQASSRASKPRACRSSTPSRKAAATRVAENWGTVDELKAIFGWKTNQQAERYVAAANRKRLGSNAPDLLVAPDKKGI